jgi:hypothetical protein
LVAVGEPRAAAFSPGQVFLFRENAQSLGLIRALDGSSGDLYGAAPAFTTSSLLVAACNEGPEHGAVYRYAPFAFPLPFRMDLVARAGDPAPGFGADRVSRLNNVVVGPLKEDDCAVSGWREWSP